VINGILFALLVISLGMALISRHFVNRCISIKLAGDSLVVLALGFSGDQGDGTMRLMSLFILGITTALVYLYLLEGKERHQEEKWNTGE